VATHPATKKKSPVGVTRSGIVYELFFTTLPQQAFTASDVIELYLHRGAFEPTLSDEDQEIDPDRWCSHSAWGQECWQWVWNLRLELGHLLEPTPIRITEFAAAIPPSSPHTDPPSGYAPRRWACAGSLTASRVTTLLSSPMGPCVALQGSRFLLMSGEERADGSLRVVYGASIRSCRPCPLREQCQWQGKSTKKPRKVSVLLHPLAVGNAPLLWRDWSRRVHRRACIQFLRSQCTEVQVEPPTSASLAVKAPSLSRAERAHYRLCWAERLARNACPLTSGQVTIRLFGLPEHFATSLGLATA
jgi:hypothetical protein